MNEGNIRKYAELMKELGLTGLEVTEDNVVVRLERGGVAAPVVKETVAVETVLSAKQPEEKKLSADITVSSPMVGIFYAAPAENAAPYVAVGDRVKKGQTLCIIEAMKLMNEITAEEDGVISEICVTNGQVVEFDTELFRIKK